MVQWVIQRNLGRTDDHGRIVEAVSSVGSDPIEVDVIPFSDDLPDVPGHRPTVFYGATGFVNSVITRGSWTPGAFYDAEAFRYSRYLQEYGERMINHGAVITTMQGFQPSGPDPIFVRPDRDLKEFAGCVIEPARFVEWRHNLLGRGYSIADDCPIVVAEPVGISTEWRLFVVEGRVVSGSRYRSRFILDPSPEVPERVVAFAEESARTWSPQPVFVMDVGLSAGNLYIIELGCFNSAGFYASDVGAVISAVDRHIRSNFKALP